MPRSLCLLFVVAAACARRTMPITATQVAQSRDRNALVEYLGQRDASPTVCDLASDGPHVPEVSADVRDELIAALHDDRLTPAIWGECVTRLIHSADVESARSVFDAVGREYIELLVNGAVERDSLAAKRLFVMHTLLLGRRDDVAPGRETMNNVLGVLRDRLKRGRLGLVATRYASEMVADIELERGMRAGRPVDEAMLDELLRSGDESTLQRYERRLPDMRLRLEAKRRIIRLHIASSRYPEVRENAAGLEETMMQSGVNQADLRLHRPVRGWIDSSALAVRSVLVRQDLQHQTSALLGYADQGVSAKGSVSVLPQLPLRGMLQVTLDGIDEPVTLCGPAELLDPSPCLTPRDVSVDSRVTDFDGDGVLRFAEQLTPPEAEALAESGRRVSVPIAVGGRTLTTLDWDLRFEAPRDLVLEGRSSGADGPGLRVRVTWLETNRLVYDVEGGPHPYHAIVERADAEHFHVISRGADGSRGSDGSSGRDGLTGSSGTNAMCPSTAGGNGARGEDGSAGENGGNGERGGRGGDIVIEVVRHGAAPDALPLLVRRAVLSEGGAGGQGGSGGSGGRGGQGGSGGMGTTCIDSDGHVSSLSGGSSGLSGSDGRSGFSGSPGASGSPGRVTLRVVESVG